MHGGNAGLESPAEERRPGSGSRRSTAGPVGEMEVRIEHVAPPSKNMRLDDFWALKLMRCVFMSAQDVDGKSHWHVGLPQMNLSDEGNI